MSKWTTYTQHSFNMSTSNKMISGVGEQLVALTDIAAQQKTKDVLAILAKRVATLDEVARKVTATATNSVQGKVMMVMHNDYMGIKYVCMGLELCGTDEQTKAATAGLQPMIPQSEIFRGTYAAQIGALKPVFVAMKKKKAQYTTLGLATVIDHLDEYIKKYSKDFSAAVQAEVEDSGNTTLAKAMADVVECFHILKKKLDSYQVEDNKSDTEEEFVKAANKVWDAAAKSQAQAKASRDKAKAEKKKLDEEAKKAAEEEALRKEAGE